MSTYTDKDLWYGTFGPRDAKFMIVGEAWGHTEAAQKSPLVGESGKELDRMLAEAGLSPARPSSADSPFLTNVIPAQPVGNDMRRFFLSTKEAAQLAQPALRGLFPRQQIHQGLELLYAQISAVNPELIIGLGNYPLWALTESSFGIANKDGWKTPTGILDWRGSQLWTLPINGKSYPFLPVIHPAAALRQWPWRRLIVHDLRARVPLRHSWAEPPHERIVRPSYSTVIEYLSNLLDLLAKGPVDVALDLETRGHRIACCGLALSAREAICIPFMCIERPEGYWLTEQDEYTITQLLRTALSHPNLRLRGQNLLYDLQYLATEWNVSPRIHRDTMLMYHVCWPGDRKGLDYISSLMCSYHSYWKEDGKEWNRTLPEEQLWMYNCTDCCRTFEAADELEKLCQSLDVYEQMLFQHRQANELALPMMLRGVRIDSKRRTEASFELASAIAEHEAYIDTLIPEDVYPRPAKAASWVRSPAQQREIFYNLLGIKPVKARTGQPTLGKEALPIVMAREPLLAPIFQKLADLRSLGVFYSTFTQAPLDADMRMRCSFNVAGTETFRWSSSENAFGTGGNLQNIPKGSDSADARLRLPNVRRFFVPDPGYELAEFDLSGADAQVVAWEAGDEDLKEAFRKGLKVHLKNARDVFPERTENLTDEEIKASDVPGGLYHNNKRMVHGSNYGGTAKGMAPRIGVPVRDVEEFQERWFYLHPGIREWHNRTLRCLEGIQCWRCFSYNIQSRKCTDCGAHCGRTVGNRFGYRKVYFDRIDGLLPQALAWTPQSSVGLVTFHSGLRLVERFSDWLQVLLQVHDSLITQYPIECRYLRPQIKAALHETLIPYKDPLCIPWGCVASTVSWGDAKAVKDW